MKILMAFNYTTTKNFLNTISNLATLNLLQCRTNLLPSFRLSVHLQRQGRGWGSPRSPPCSYPACLGLFFFRVRNRKLGNTCKDIFRKVAYYTDRSERNTKTIKSRRRSMVGHFTTGRGGGGGIYKVPYEDVQPRDSTNLLKSDSDAWVRWRSLKVASSSTRGSH